MTSSDNNIGRMGPLSLGGVIQVRNISFSMINHVLLKAFRGVISITQGQNSFCDFELFCGLVHSTAIDLMDS